MNFGTQRACCVASHCTYFIRIIKQLIFFFYTCTIDNKRNLFLLLISIKKYLETLIIMMMSKTNDNMLTKITKTVFLHILDNKLLNHFHFNRNPFFFSFLIILFYSAILFIQSEYDDIIYQIIRTSKSWIMITLQKKI